MLRRGLLSDLADESGAGVRTEHAEATVARVTATLICWMGIDIPQSGQTRVEMTNRINQTYTKRYRHLNETL